MHECETCGRVSLTPCDMETPCRGEYRPGDRVRVVAGLDDAGRSGTILRRDAGGYVLVLDGSPDFERLARPSNIRRAS